MRRSTEPGSADDLLVDQVLLAEEQRRAAVLAGDADALERLLGDDLRYGHTGGAWDTKQVYVEKVRSGDLRFLALSSEQVEAQVHGDTVLLWLETLGHVVTPTADKQMRNRTLSVWERHGDAVVLAAHQTTVLPL